MGKTKLNSMPLKINAGNAFGVKNVLVDKSNLFICYPLVRFSYLSAY